LIVHTLDLNFLGMPQAIAAYLVVGPAGPALIESGPASTLEALRARLAEHGYAPADIRHVLLTHIHLDHAGAAGWWARQGARIYVHHVGAPHLIDPSKLLNSARRIYGETMDRLWGEVLPVPADQLTALSDGDVVQAGGLSFSALDTPGHAYHHHVYRLGDVAFTGDAAGIHLPGSALIFLPSPPPEFDLEAWQRTLARLAGENFAAIYPTHFGAVEDPREHLAQLGRLLVEAAHFVRDRMLVGVERDPLIEQYTAWNRARAEALGVSEDVFLRYQATNPLFMAVDGILRYWRKKWQS
jgi:glyoxylase-like metal-dependent hydrolase (beta-lactamase superfamily II)